LTGFTDISFEYLLNPNENLNEEKEKLRIILDCRNLEIKSVENKLNINELKALKWNLCKTHEACKAL